MDWTGHLLEQLTFYWDRNVRTRLEGLTDDEYLWEPVPDSWSIRPRSQASSSMAGGAGDLVFDYEWPEPTPAPVPTIAWRMGHVIVDVFGARNASHFGGPPMHRTTVVWPATAAGAITLLEENYERWVAGVASLDTEALAQPVGEAEGSFAAHPYIGLVLHIHREAIHHMAEVSLLRDLYARTPPR